MAADKYDPVRSARIDNVTWNKAKRRASYEGVTMSHVMFTLVEGYANGMIDMPRVQKIYQRPKVEENAGAAAESG